MAIYDFFVSRNNAVSNTAAYVGHAGRLFYDDSTGVIKLSDGSTPGGTFIPYNIATTSTVGGIKAGAGANVSVDGTLTIDTSGLPLSIGNLSIADTTISSAVADENVIIATNGTGNIEIVGAFNVHSTEEGNIDQALSTEPIFSVKADGQVQMLVPGADQLAGAFEIIGNDAGDYWPPNQTGVIIHTTGNQDSVSRVYNDANNNYPIWVGRRYNGNIASPSQVLNGEVIMRIAGQAMTSAGDFETFGPAKINWMATEDQGPNNQGGKITIDVTANGTKAFGNVVTVAEFTSDGLVSNVGFVGNVLTNAQPYITSVGTLTSLAIAGDINVSGNIVGNTSTTLATMTTANIGNVNVAKMNITSGGRRTIEGGIYANLNFATDSIVNLYHPTGAVTVNLSNYRAGATVRLIIRMNTRRTINLGVASTENSTKGSTTIVENTLLNNSCVILNYTCMDGTAGNTYVGVNTVD